MKHELHILTEDDYLAARLTRLEAPWSTQRIASAESIATTPPDEIVLIDAACKQLPPTSAPNWLIWARTHPIIVVSSAPNDDEGLRYLEAGVSGYCHAFAPIEALIQVLNVVASGEQWVGRSLLNRLLRGLSRHKQEQPGSWIELLSRRESEVARLAANGESNLAISQALNISERTVKAHLSACFVKLDVPDRLQLALKVHGLRP